MVTYLHWQAAIMWEKHKRPGSVQSWTSSSTTPWPVAAAEAAAAAFVVSGNGSGDDSGDVRENNLGHLEDAVSRESVGLLAAARSGRSRIHRSLVCLHGLPLSEKIKEVLSALE